MRFFASLRMTEGGAQDDAFLVTLREHSDRRVSRDEILRFAQNDGKGNAQDDAFLVTLREHSDRRVSKNEIPRAAPSG
ncbi:hypothetical protein SAMN06265340_101147 [Desulfurobacterium atlanticum]|uniref:Uncharacterized protein n=1 Tax=Desulfurobacterium atlanticum TaxID=240169 RepID=A0A238XQH6_9BACT|nr:hypothetical protein SAMN06265340_101147 [Desulfurobacterium atlanticum]